MYSIIKLCWLHGFPWFSHPFLYSIAPGTSFKLHLYLYEADVNKFLLVNQHWCVHVQGFIKECYIYVHPCFYLDDFWDGRWVAIQLQSCEMLFQEFVQNSMQKSCVTPINMLFIVHMVHLYSSSELAIVLKKSHPISFHLIDYISMLWYNVGWYIYKYCLILVMEHL